MSAKKLNTNAWQIPKYTIHEFFKKKKTKYCLVIPVINEGTRIQKELAKIKKYTPLIDVVLVDGGSTDGSLNTNFLRKQKVRALLTSPKGQSIQYRAAFAYALKQDYEGIVTIDGNNKDDPSALPKFTKALDEGFDYIQASRFIKGGKHAHTPSDRIFFNRLVISPLLSLAAGKWYTDTPLALRGYSQKYLLHPGVQPFRGIFQRYELLFYLVTRANRLGLKSKEIPTKRSYPKGVVPTKIIGWKKVTDMINVIKIALGRYNPK